MRHAPASGIPCAASFLVDMITAGAAPSSGAFFRRPPWRPWARRPPCMPRTCQPRHGRGTLESTPPAGHFVRRAHFPAGRGRLAPLAAARHAAERADRVYTLAQEINERIRIIEEKGR